MPDMSGEVRVGGFATSDFYGTGAPTGTPIVAPLGYFRRTEGAAFHVWPTAGGGWLVACSPATAAGSAFIGATASAGTYSSGSAVASGTATLAVSNVGTGPVAVEVYVDAFDVAVNGAGGKSHPTLAVDFDNGSGSLVSTGLVYSYPMFPSTEARRGIVVNARPFMASHEIAAGATITYRTRLWVGANNTSFLTSWSASPRIRAVTMG